MQEAPRPSSLRRVAPLAIVTGTSMLAMDLYLPAVPALQAALELTVSEGQATVAVFLAALAASQLLWGEAMTRYGPRWCVAVGTSALVLSSIGCALAPNLPLLLALRIVQGVAAGAATVVAPSVVRATLPDHDAVRGMALIGMIESIVPAAGPVLGTALLRWTDWRGTFWVLAAATLLALPLVLRITPRQLPGLDRSVPARHADILANRRYLRLTLSHALCIGALLTFVASAPQLLQHALGRGPEAFALLQVIGVASFMLGASRSGAVARRLGNARVVQLGAAVQLGLTGVLGLAAAFAAPPFWAIAAYWSLFCGSLALRGPAAFSDALGLPPAQLGRATAMMILALLAAGSLGTQAVAPFIGGGSALPVAAAMALMLGASLWLVLPYPAARVQ